MDVLLTFTGFHDPYFKGLVDQEEQTGPILSLLATRPVDQIFLFDTPMTKKATEQSDRFPSDFMFELTRDEIRNISQFVISSPDLKYSKSVYAFTVQ
jgi:hypothetical protein